MINVSNILILIYKGYYLKSKVQLTLNRLNVARIMQCIYSPNPDMPSFQTAICLVIAVMSYLQCHFTMFQGNLSAHRLWNKISDLVFVCKKHFYGRNSLTNMLSILSQAMRGSKVYKWIQAFNDDGEVSMTNLT